MNFYIIQIYELNDTLKSLNYLLQCKEDNDMPFKAYGELKKLSLSLNDLVMGDYEDTPETEGAVNALDEIINDMNEMIDDFSDTFDVVQVLLWVTSIRPLVEEIVKSTMKLSLDDIDNIMSEKATLHASLEYQGFYKQSIYNLKEKLLNLK